MKTKTKKHDDRICRICGGFNHEETLHKTQAHTPDLLDIAKFQQAADEGEPWAIEKIQDMLTDNEGRDYRTVTQLFMFLRRAAIDKAEG